MFYRASLLFGAIPLVAGVSIYLLWLLTGWDGFITAGLVLLMLGVPIVVIAAGCFLAYIIRSGANSKERRRSWLPTLLPPALILSNPPAALIISGLAMAGVTGHRVIILNESPAAIEALSLYSQGLEERVGSIGPGESAKATLYFEGDSSLMFSALVQGQYETGFASDYVTNSMGGETILRLTSDSGFVARQNW